MQSPLDPASARLANKVIEAMAGPGAVLRTDQEEAVSALCVPGSRVLVVQATGWGKSAIYWAATAILRAAGAGPTLVVSPLLSLMRDQVEAASRAGLRAATLNSSNSGEWEEIESALQQGRIDVLLVSPERLANPGFGARVMEALAGRIGLLVIDEAHTVSDWGHDFRPDYRRVAALLGRINPTTPVLATTATANQRVTDDVAGQLGGEALVLRGSLARSSLELAVVGPLAPIERFAWVVEHLPLLPGSGIVYALTVSDAQRLTSAVRGVHGEKLEVAAYTGQIESAEREALEEALKVGRVKALIATSALGMGFDKPDLGFVVHVGSPPSPVSYYQQIGRAGRGIDRALVALLPSESDERVWHYFATATIPDPAQVERLLAGLATYEGGPATIPGLEAETGLRRGRIEMMLRQLAVDGVVERGEKGWMATGQAWTYDAQHYEGILATRRREAGIMRAYVAGQACLMQLLQSSLDDPGAAPCGRCSFCTGRLPEPLGERPSAEVVQQVKSLLRGETLALEPRKMWPGGAYGARGRIAPGEMAGEGRVIAFADAPEWRELVRAAFEIDAAPSAELRAAAVATLSRWKRDWPKRPEVVVGLPASGFDRLVEGLADHLAEAGHLDRAALAMHAGPHEVSEMASGEEAAYWDHALEAEGQYAPAVRGRCVLLVVDATSSQWPITVAAAKLRRAGATMVLPLLVHRRP
ncbi:MAG: DEAD/DEAH box helicase [Actinomycetota bacterium]|nr:DEAD/DEAH box helicase [Actinomycetota bacterium]